MTVTDIVPRVAGHPVAPYGRGKGSVPPSMDDKLDRLLGAITDVRLEVVQLRTEMHGQSSRADSHEKWAMSSSQDIEYRIRALESFKWKILALSVAAGAITGVIVSWLVEAVQQASR